MVFPLGCVSVFDDAYPPTKCFIGAANKKKRKVSFNNSGKAS